MKVLFVDDDPNILVSYKRNLRKQFQIETALNGKAGLDALDSLGPFAVVVSDMRMPGMDGVQFLSQVRQRAPKIVNIMLTGNADLQTAIDAVNEGSVFRFLTKPCSSEDLANSINAGLRQYQLVTAEQELTKETLIGSVKMLTNVVSRAKPTLVKHTTRITHYAKLIATIMQLSNLWQIEVAAMLSQIGCLSLPSDILGKLDIGQGLSLREHMMYSSHPSLGSGLVEGIPRLEPVALMIKQQLKPYVDYESSEDIAKMDNISLGAQILRIAIGLDQMIASGFSYEKALVKMRKQPGEYNPKIVDRLSVKQMG